MRPRLPALVLFAAIFLAPWCAVRSEAQQPSATYDLAGQVVNSVTGEPIGGALVEVYSSDRQAQFSGANGAFHFTDLPPGRFPVVARKPGFFNDEQMRNRRHDDVATIPSQTNFIVKLVPEAIIFGQVTGAHGEPLERILVSAQHWEIEDGRRQLQRIAVTITDDQGDFRIAELQPGAYFLSFAPFGSRSIYGGLGPKKADTPGYGPQFYPGVADFTSATPITLTQGAQFQADQALSAEATFAITGRVVGANGARGLNVALIDSEGEPAQHEMRLDPRSGEFRISGVPAGKYTLMARALNAVSIQVGDMLTSRVLSPRQQQIAYIPLSVSSDVSGVVLALGPGISIPIHVDDETTKDTSGDPHRVFIRLVPDDSSRFLQRVATAPRYGREQVLPASIDDVAPGTYSVEARPLGGMFYVSDLRCGTVDLLRDNLTVAASGSLPPIDVTLRDDGAQLTGTVTQNGKPVEASVVIYSPDYPQRSQIVGAANGSFFSPNLAPGTYEVFAVSNPQSVEFRNPAAMQNYLAHATSVTLGAGGQSSVQLELPSTSEDQP